MAILSDGVWFFCLGRVNLLRGLSFWLCSTDNHYQTIYKPMCTDLWQCFGNKIHVFECIERDSLKTPTKKHGNCPLSKVEDAAPCSWNKFLLFLHNTLYRQEKFKGISSALIVENACMKCMLNKIKSVTPAIPFSRTNRAIWHFFIQVKTIWLCRLNIHRDLRNCDFKLLIIIATWEAL